MWNNYLQKCSHSHRQEKKAARTEFPLIFIYQPWWNIKRSFTHSQLLHTYKTFFLSSLAHMSLLLHVKTFQLVILICFFFIHSCDASFSPILHKCLWREVPQHWIKNFFVTFSILFLLFPPSQRWYSRVQVLFFLFLCQNYLLRRKWKRRIYKRKILLAHEKREYDKKNSCDNSDKKKSIQMNVHENINFIVFACLKRNNLIPLIYDVACKNSNCCF